VLAISEILFSLQGSDKNQQAPLLTLPAGGLTHIDASESPAIRIAESRSQPDQPGSSRVRPMRTGETDPGSSFGAGSAGPSLRFDAEVAITLMS